MEKRISTTQLRAAKRVAITVAGNLAKRKKAEQEIKKWTDVFNHQEKVILNYEAGLMADTGLRSEQIVTKVIQPTGKFDKNGKELKQTKYVINDNVRFDSDTKEYVVTIKDEGDKEVAPVQNEGDMEGDPYDSAEEVAQVIEDLVEECADVTAVSLAENTEEPVVEEQHQETFEEMFSN